MSVVSDSRHFHCDVDAGNGDSLQVNASGASFTFEIEEPWAGSTETGFGATTCIAMSRADATALYDWLGQRLAEVPNG